MYLSCLLFLTARVSVQAINAIETYKFYLSRSVTYIYLYHCNFCLKNVYLLFAFEHSCCRKTTSFMRKLSGMVCQGHMLRSLLTTRDVIADTLHHVSRPLFPLENGSAFWRAKTNRICCAERIPFMKFLSNSLWLNVHKHSWQSNSIKVSCSVIPISVTRRNNFNQRSFIF